MKQFPFKTASLIYYFHKANLRQQIFSDNYSYLTIL